jgi:hypothetical protein
MSNPKVQNKTNSNVKTANLKFGFWTFGFYLALAFGFWNLDLHQ